MPPRLEMRGVCKSFGATPALGGVDLVVQAGQVHALLGQNGAGKSTLMKILSGAIRPDAGQLRLDGQPYSPRNPLQARRLGVAMIYQELSLAPHLTVAQNIFLGMEPTRHGLVRTDDLNQRARQALVELNQSAIRPEAIVSTLSPAAQQVVEIARAAAVGCRVLVLDEPTSSLSRTDAEALFSLIARLRQQGQSIVYITHFIEEAKRIADRFTVLRDGVSVGTGDASDVEIAQIVELMVGRRMEELFPRSPRSPGEVLLDVSKLSGTHRPHDASFTLHRGEVLGIAGLVGAGRTELLRALAGLDPIASGQVRLGVHTGPAAPTARWKQGLALVSENRKDEGLALGLSIADNLTLSRLPRIVRPAQRRAEVAAWLRKLDVRCEGSDQPVGELSGGNQQKVAIARLLYHGVDVLLLDEPTRGIDVASKAQIYRLIDDLVTKDQPPKAVIVVSSYLPELLGVCDRIAVMCRGQLGPARPVDGLDEQILLAEAAKGNAAAA